MNFSLLFHRKKKTSLTNYLYSFYIITICQNAIVGHEEDYLAVGPKIIIKIKIEN